jgi:hypothetical protein
MDSPPPSVHIKRAAALRLLKSVLSYATILPPKTINKVLPFLKIFVEQAKVHFDNTV